MIPSSLRVCCRPPVELLRGLSRRRILRGLLGLAVVWAVVVPAAPARTLRLFVIGNSFSNNATRFLPDLVRAGGHELVTAKAATGGCSLERHWNALAADLADPADPKGKIYAGKSLRENLGTGPWEVITIQQYSLHSSDPSTYQPYARQLVERLKALQPGAEIVLHQTWAYRVDAAKFGQVSGGGNAGSNREMWELSRAAYRRIAAELGVRLIPTGDAFWRIDSDPMWGYRPDATFDFKQATAPALPVQTHSLHVGYRWDKAGKLGKDANHANVAGEYLGALVWYGFLFGESPEKLAFVPPGLAPDFAAHLRRVAWEVVRQ
ncbi:MAG: DUF4886 domain-containing protein [Verrucomicrobia bacterium]|nr:DUF4886 domain-containing protein [Verrucomicrobiota bacterium]